MFQLHNLAQLNIFCSGLGPEDHVFLNKGRFEIKCKWPWGHDSQIWKIVLKLMLIYLSGDFLDVWCVGYL